MLFSWQGFFKLGIAGLLDDEVVEYDPGAVIDVAIVLRPYSMMPVSDQWSNGDCFTTNVGMGDLVLATSQVRQDSFGEYTSYSKTMSVFILLVATW